MDTRCDVAYGVHIRVDIMGKDRPVTLTYNAGIALTLVRFVSSFLHPVFLTLHSVWSSTEYYQFTSILDALRLGWA